MIWFLKKALDGNLCEKRGDEKVQWHIHYTIVCLNTGFLMGGNLIKKNKKNKNATLPDYFISVWFKAD